MINRFLYTLSIILLFAPNLFAKDSGAEILFLGLWDRVYPEIEEASQATGVPIDKISIQNFTTPDEVKKHYQKVAFEKYNLIYVLQINQIEAQVLVSIFMEAMKKNQSLKIVQLDHRSSHQELLSNGILKVNPLVKEYWRNFSMGNLKNLLIYSSVEYLNGEGNVQPPSIIAQNGIYYPGSPSFFQTLEEYRSWYEEKKLFTKGNPWVVIILKPDYVIYKNARIYDALIAELEKNNVNVCPVFGELSELRKLIKAVKPDLMILQHHSGPESTNSSGQESFLDEIGAPYLYGAGLLGTVTTDEWKEDVRSTSWVGYASMARHEFHGIIEPQIIGAKENSGDGYYLDVPIQERLEHFVSRIMGWLDLRSKPEAEKKIAIIYFHKYMGKSDVGRSAMEMGRYFNIPRSLLSSLHMLKDQGYSTGSIPANEDDMLDLMIHKGRNIPAWSTHTLDEYVASSNPILIEEEAYSYWFKTEISEENQKKVIAMHGPPPGNRMVWTDQGKRYIVLPRNQFGNILLAPQPSIGVIEDTSIVKSKTIPPSHNFLAFYWWLQKEFKADAFIHFGAFGSDVSLPGKEIFLSKDCWPDIIMDDIPNIYIWPIENIGIGVIAKRRTYAVLIDHLVAQNLPASFSVDFVNLENSIHLYLESEENKALQKKYQETITEQAFKLNFIELFNIPCDSNHVITHQQILKLRDYLTYYQMQNSPRGMHVLGEIPPEDQIIPSIAKILWNNTQFFEKLLDKKVIEGDPNKAVSSSMIIELLTLLADTVEENRDDVDKKIFVLTGFTLAQLYTDFENEIALIRRVKASYYKSADLEKRNLLAALDGKYISPGSGGTPLTNPEVLPTGRNMYGINPYQIPSKVAWETGKVLLDETLNDYKAKHGEFPKRLAFSLTGMETFRDMGVMEAQILYLIGIKPKWNPGGLVTGLEIITSEELGRPRIDPLVSISSIYIKNFPFLIEFLDLAIHTAASIEEKNNYLRQVNKEIMARLIEEGDATNDVAEKLAGTRIFGSNAGAGGARLIWLLPRSGTWDTKKDIVNVWANNRSHIYGKEKWSEQNKILYGYVLSKREMIITNCGNNLYGPLTNHHYPEEAGGLALAAKLIGESDPEIIVQDLRNRKAPSSRPLEQVIVVELMSTALDTAWIRSQMKQGYQGATQFMQLADNLFQWEAVNEGTVSNAIWESMVDIYVDDKYSLNISNWFNENNPFAFQQMTATLLEADRKGFWETTAERRRALVLKYAESVIRYTDNAGPYTGGNKKFHDLIIYHLEQMEKVTMAKDYKWEVSKEHKLELNGNDIEGH